ncbi:amidase [Isoptericola nanjingensis]|uniref:amidase n=1 Tax=Isoptericola nanjingensis TaxID=903413 RepID=UPI003D2195CD
MTVATPPLPTLPDAAARLAAGALTSAALVDAVLDVAAATEGDVHAYVALDPDAARAAAHAADAAPGPRGPLHGLPVGVKDLIATADLPTRAGSASWTPPAPPRDAAVVRALRAAGAVVVGKHHTHEFGYGTSEPPTRRPDRPDLYAGGSTVGGAVSVAVASCLAAIGTDGGGSVRKPASLLGLVGLKPTHGAVSTDGLLPGATANDHVGWITRDVAGSALLLDALTTLGGPLGRTVTGLRLGCPGALFRDLEPGIEAAVRRCLDLLAAAGAEVVPVEIPELDLAADAHGTLGAFESAAMHRDVPAAVRDGYHPGTRRFLDEAARVTPEQAAQARTVRARVRGAVDAALDDARLDVLCSPTLALGALPLAAMRPEADLPRYCRLTMPFNLTGHPAVSVPCGVDGPTPVGFQVVARHSADLLALRVAAAVEDLGTPGRT